LDRFDVVVIGAGAAGMMCAIEAGKRGRRVLVIEHAQAAGEKIRISGGGRCNFTNLHAGPDNYISQNPGFCISPLRRYGPQDFVGLIEQAGIAYHEKAMGQLFCDGSARQVVDLLLSQMRRHGVALRLGASVDRIERGADGFRLTVGGTSLSCQSLVVATGGKSIPKMGASGFGYALAAQFGVAVTETRPALAPLTLSAGLLERLKPMAGVSVQASVTSGGIQFNDAMLFTHRGLSGPAILQISCYWREGGEIRIDLAPGVDMFDILKAARRAHGRQAPQTVLAEHLPRKLAQSIAEAEGLTGNLADLPDAALRRLVEAVNAWRLKPVGSEGYRTAEVTLGGVDTRDLDSRTMAAKAVAGLYFIGEVVDVTGWLGGYNFQWAWSSGWCAGQAV
jgi:predicted Rossmann fold flavoprotein